MGWRAVRGQLADDAVQPGRLGLGDRARAHGPQGELVGVEVGVAVHAQRDDERDHHARCGRTANRPRGPARSSRRAAGPSSARSGGGARDVVLPGTGPWSSGAGVPVRWNERRADGVPAGIAGRELRRGRPETSRNEGLTSNASTRIDPGTGLHMTSTDTTAPRGRLPGPGRHPVRRRLRRRHAAHRRPVHLARPRRSATTSRRCPNFPAEIRAPAGTLPGVSSFQLHFAELRHPHPRRPAGRAGRDEPGRAEGQPRRPASRAAS